MIRVWHRAREPVTVLAATAFVGLLSTSQRWAGLDTPDSSFYASLSLFGDEVTDRAPENSYYWTRLGVIVPNRVLTEVLGAFPGFAAYRMLLVLLIVAGSYVTLRRFTGLIPAAFLATVASLSTVMLSYLGNPFPTGSVMAGTVVLIACAMFDGKKAAAAAGITVGWLVMVNPPGVLLAATIWLVLRVQQRTRPVPLLVASGTAAATFATLLMAGRIVFPRLDWLGAYVNANARLDYSDYASSSAVWLHDISLLVPAAIALVVTVGWVTHRSAPAAQRALVISLTSLAFMLVFSPMLGGIPLEAPMYQSMLWPPAMLALGLLATVVLPEGSWTRAQVASGALAIVVVIVAGHATWRLTFAWGAALLAGCGIIALTAAYRGTLGVILGLAVLLAGAQLLQNARGDIGLYHLSPYNWAYNANPISERLHTAVNAQEWLLAHTTRDDQILSWVQGDWVGGDRELYVVAGMQLWGENRVTLEPRLTPDDISRLDDIRPSVIAMYGQTMDGVLDFWSSLPAANAATPPDCYDFPWTPNPASAFTVTQGHACLTRLTWGDR